MLKDKIRHAHRNDLYTDLNHIREAIADAASSVKDRASDLLSHRLTNLTDKTTDIESDVVDYVTEQPIKSVGLAILAGVVIGLYLRR